MPHPITANNPRAFTDEIKGKLDDGREYSLSHIVPADKDKIEQLTRIYQDVYKDLGEDWSDKNAHKLVTDLFITNPLNWVAFVEGEIAGGISLDRKMTFEGETLVGREFFISSGLQHSGLGTKMFSHVLELARVWQPKAESFELITFRDQGVARIFYDTLGFKDDPRLIVMNGNLGVVREGLKTRMGESTRR